MRSEAKKRVCHSRGGPVRAYGITTLPASEEESRGQSSQDSEDPERVGFPCSPALGDRWALKSFSTQEKDLCMYDPEIECFDVMCARCRVCMAVLACVKSGVDACSHTLTDTHARQHGKNRTVSGLRACPGTKLE